MIGIVGGIGPLAGADLYQKIVENTIAHSDQEHVPVLMASLPHLIADRTAFLLGKTDINPAFALAEVILMLERAGSSHIGIACNTAHAPRIFDVIQDELRKQNSRATIVHLIDETIAAIRSHSYGFQRVGVLSTSGTFKTRLYLDKLENAGLTPVALDFEQHDALVHRSIYDPAFGIKSTPTVHPEAVLHLNDAIHELHALGAEAVLLGCTEIGMVEEHLDFGDLEVFNPNTILARTLIQRTFPQKLKP